MKKIHEVAELTYIGVFLTFRCMFRCSYCINRHLRLDPRKEMSASEWIEGLNRLNVPREQMVPITLQGGEPSSHPGFFDIINGLDEKFYIDILTNLQFDIDQIVRNIPPQRLRRDVPYASIRVSYHPEFSELENLLDKIQRLQDAGYSIGLFAVDHPETDIDLVREKADSRNIDFRTKEFLGNFNGSLYGEYKYEGAVNGKVLKEVQCQSKELLIAPDGSIHRCHRDLYHGENSVGHILDDHSQIHFQFRDCNRFGECNPCDIKIKNNRFQKFGHCSVTVKQA